jgi:NADPH2:quinone reductase
VTAILCVDALDLSHGDTVLIAGATGGVDAIIDLVNFSPGSYDAALKDGGRVSSATNAAGGGRGRTNVMAAPTPEILGRVAQHLADGTVRISIQQAFDLAKAPEALQARGSSHTRGKIAVRVT